MNKENKFKAFMKMGFYEVDLKNVSLSCGYCKKPINAGSCTLVESEITNSRHFKERIEFICPDCKKPIIGADV